MTKHKYLVFKSMTRGSYVGEVDIILRRRRKYSVTAGDSCKLFYISRYEFENVI